MTEKIQYEPDATDMVVKLLEKTVAGKIPWKPTADNSEFVVSLKGTTTLRLYTTSETGYNEYNEREEFEVPMLSLEDEKGRRLWQAGQQDVKTPGALRNLHKAARRVANRVDDRITQIVKALDELN